MKKNLTILSFLLLAFAITNAQSLDFQNAENSNKQKLIKHIISKQFNNNHLLKPTGIKQRVIGQSWNTIQPEVGCDSLRYTYTGTNGSNYDYNQLEFPFQFALPAVRMDYFYERLRSPSDLLADSIISCHAQDNFAISQIETAHYRADKKIDSIKTHYLDANNSMRKNLMSYTANGNVASYTTIVNSSSIDTIQHTIFTYNANNDKIIADTLYVEDLGSLNLVGYNEYKYNTTGNYDTVYRFLNGVPQMRFAFDYYLNGKLRKVTQQNFDNNNWLVKAIDSIGYTAGSSFYTYWSTTVYQIVGGNPINSATRYKMQYPGTHAGPDSVAQFISYNNGLLNPVGIHYYTYNEYDNPIRLDNRLFYPGEPEFVRYDLFHYETFDDNPLSVKNIANKNFSVFPNPFHNRITIDWKGIVSSEKVMVKMVNILGQEMFKKSLPINKGLNEIQIPDVNDGNYILIIQDAEGKTYQDKLIKK